MRRSVVAIVGATALLASMGWAPSAWAEEGAPPNASVESIPVIQSAEPGDTADEAKPSGRDSKQSTQERLALELKFARGEGKAKDVNGFMKSLYQGKWYMPKKEAVRRCIIDRESNFHYKAVSRGGIYRGAYQMNRALARGVSWMMQKEMRKEMGAEGVKLAKALRSTKTHLWNRYMQDRAFWRVWALGEGSRHWGAGARMCIKKAKRAEARRQAQEQAAQESDGNQGQGDDTPGRDADQNQ